jgi:hypothetical protein
MERSQFATMSDAAAEYVINVGRENRDREWILSPFDSWHRNPFFDGISSNKHPEDDYSEE